MPRIITISTQGDFFRTVKTLNRMKKNLPKMTKEGMRRWGRILERDMRQSARDANIRDLTGILQSTGIRYEQGVRSNVGYLFIRLYGVYLDSMRPHFVNVHRRRTRLLLWAKLSGSSSIRRKAIMVEQRKLNKFSIYVRPHPFIAQGYRKARPKLKPVLKRVAQRAINNS